MEEFADKLSSSPWVRWYEEGTALPSFVSMLLDDDVRGKGKGVDGQLEFDLRWTANSMYAASIDTVSTFHTLNGVVFINSSHNRSSRQSPTSFSPWFQYPEVLRRAQAEVDAVIGQTRLPVCEDRDSLPYCNAVFTEALRWSVPVPLSLPHRLMEDDIYDGMFIPKGSMIFSNIWAILRNEKLYPDPHCFNPNRYLHLAADNGTDPDPRRYVFGFGRRRCPGSHLVESSTWLLMVSVIATLNIAKAVDDQGRQIEPEVMFNDYVFRLPSPFKCSIRPRSEHVLKMLAREDA
ncbi:cytochrome P450 [Melanogaster broomeanus]|nr:cytochrome P450 [Melanogaster broomeanus]